MSRGQTKKRKVVNSGSDDSDSIDDSDEEFPDPSSVARRQTSVAHQKSPPAKGKPMPKKTLPAKTNTPKNLGPKTKKKNPR